MGGHRLILLAVLLTHVSAVRAFTWEDSRDYGLGPGRNRTLESCAVGRSGNERGLSYFAFQNSTLDEVFREGKMTREQVDATVRGQQAAMKVLCPEVW